MCATRSIPCEIGQSPPPPPRIHQQRHISSVPLPRISVFVEMHAPACFGCCRCWVWDFVFAPSGFRPGCWCICLYIKCFAFLCVFLAGAIADRIKLKGERTRAPTQKCVYRFVCVYAGANGYSGENGVETAAVPSPIFFNNVRKRAASEWRDFH